MRVSVARIVVPRPDWSRMIIDLHHREYSSDHIGHALGRSGSWVKTVKNGGHQPRYHDGVALIQLWAALMDRTVADAPMVRQPHLGKIQSLATQ